MSSALEWVASFGGPAGVLAGVAGKGLFDRQVRRVSVKRTDAEAAQLISAAAVALVEPLRVQISDLTNRVETLESENAATKSILQLALEYIRSLRSWIHTHLPEKTPPNPPPALGI